MNNQERTLPRSSVVSQITARSNRGAPRPRTTPRGTSSPRGRPGPSHRPKTRRPSRQARSRPCAPRLRASAAAGRPTGRGRTSGTRSASRAAPCSRSPPSLRWTSTRGGRTSTTAAATGPTAAAAARSRFLLTIELWPGTRHLHKTASFSSTAWPSRRPHLHQRRRLRQYGCGRRATWTPPRSPPRRSCGSRRSRARRARPSSAFSSAAVRRRTRA